MIALILFLGLSFFLSPITFYGWAISTFGEKPPKPTITLAEFPFEIVYTVNDEVFTIKDTYVCEFDGYTVSGSDLKNVRSWKGFVKSTGEAYITVLEGGTRGEEDAWRVFLSVGSPMYYMNDPTYQQSGAPLPQWHVDGISKWGEEYTSYSHSHIFVQKDGGFHLKIVSHQFSEPIENTFE